MYDAWLSGKWSLVEMGKTSFKDCLHVHSAMLMVNDVNMRSCVFR